MIEIRHLKLVDTVAKVGSLKKAAEHLFLTSSALSHQLKELEEQLGTKVFYRVNNKLHFTPAGKEFLESGKEILAQLNELEYRVQQMDLDHLKNYIHGYSQAETQRLNDQASTVADLIHWDSEWEPGSLILEAGCGVGAQTTIIASKNPSCRFIATDIATKSLDKASKHISSSGIKNVEFQQADVFSLPFEDNYFDHVFVCFLLEHIPKPSEGLLELKRVLKTGGTITVIEGDHGSTFFYPESEAATKAIEAQAIMQSQRGCSPNLGRQLHGMLLETGFSDLTITPRVVYVDDTKPEMKEGFVKKTFTAMIKGIADEAISRQLISRPEMQQAIADLSSTADKGGSFCYTFFKGIGIK